MRVRLHHALKRLSPQRRAACKAVRRKYNFQANFNAPFDWAPYRAATAHELRAWAVSERTRAAALSPDALRASVDGVSTSFTELLMRLVDTHVGSREVSGRKGNVFWTPALKDLHRAKNERWRVWLRAQWGTAVMRRTGRCRQRFCPAASFQEGS